MIKLRHVPFFSDEWLVGTATMPVADVGVYIQAVALIYSHGGEVECDELRRIVRCRKQVFEASLGRLLALGKLTLHGTRLRSERCTTTIRTCHERVLKLTDNGRKGGRPPNDINDLPKPNGSYARAKGNQSLKEDSLREEGEGLGRCAPSGEVAAEDSDPPAAPETEPGLEVDALVASAVAHLEGKRTRVVDPVAYERGIEAAKWQNWLASLHPLIAQHLSGAALWPAYQAISTAQAAGSREATPRDVRDVLNSLAKLRPPEMRAAA